MRTVKKSYLLFAIIVIAIIYTMVLTSNILSIDKNKTNGVENIIAGLRDEENLEYEYVYVEEPVDYVLKGDSITMPFKVNTKDIISNFTYSNNGFKIVSVEKTDQKTIICNLKCSDTGNYDITINMVLRSGKKLSGSLYAFKNQYGIFLSEFSKDEAVEKYIRYAQELEIIDDIAADQLRMQCCADSVIENICTIPSSVSETKIAKKSSGAKSSGNTYISGVFQWIDDGLNPHYLRGIKVEVYDSNLIGATFLGNTFTNNQGYYSLEFTNDTSIFENGGRDLFVKVYAGDGNFDVYKNDGTTKYYWESGHEDHQNVATGSITDISRTFTMDSNLGRAMQISQAITTVQDYAWSMMGEEPNSVAIQYPTTDSGCYYSPSEQRIYITGRSPETGMPKSYASWDVIMHEYGHHLQNQLNNADNPGGSHSSSQNIADARGNKSEGIRLAWAEAWPTVLAMVAQDYYSEYLTEIAAVNGPYYESYNGASYDIETCTARLGEACERSIIAVLWDLFDSGTETNDTISLSYHNWWDVTTENQDKTFSDFIQYFYEQYPEYRLDLGTNLTYYKMAADLGITSGYTNVDLTYGLELHISPQGGSVLFPNNIYTVMFFNEDYTSEFRMPGMLNVGGMGTSGWFSKTIEHVELVSTPIMSFQGEYMHIVVCVYQNNYPSTGWYIGKKQTISLKMFKSTVSETGDTTITGMYFHYLDTMQLTIPEQIEGHTVTGIGNNAFKNAPYLSISFANRNNIVSIGESAFENSSLGVFGIPENVLIIQKNTFKGLNSPLIDYWGSPTTIGEGAFYGTSIEYLAKIPSSVTTIGKEAYKNSAFPGKFALEANNSLTTIGESAFSNTNIMRINLSSSVNTIYQNAFKDCNNLTIYTAHASKPTGWNNNWNSSNRPVFWECTLSSDKTYVVSFVKSNSNPTNRGSVNGISDPYRDGYNFGGWYTSPNFSGTQYTGSNIASAPNGTLYAKWTEKSCVAEGTLITLADGTQVAVEDLTGEEDLLVWNMLMGEYDSAPILFIDSDPSMAYEIIELTFSDGTEVKVIDEHAFFDMTVGEYIFLRSDAAQYIGHYFNKQGTNGAWTTVQLTDVDVYTEVTTAWSPVTYGHLCYYVNGMLSMPGATEGLVNIFEVDTTLMQYDEEAMEEDVLTYGLFTYEEFNAIIPLPELVFDAFCGQYLKVSIGKGLITLSEIAALLERYSGFFE